MNLTKDQLDISVRNIYTALDVLGGKWKIKILGQIHYNKGLRFNDFLKQLPGLSSKVLSSQLKELERDDLITRVLDETSNTKVEYQLTEIGKNTEPILVSLCNWAGENYYKGN